MDHMSARENATPLEIVSEISGDLSAYSRFFIVIGILDLFAALVLHESRSASIFEIGGILLLTVGVLLGFVAREFSRLKRWTYPIVKLLVGSPVRLDTAYLDRYPQKIQSTEVRQLFGL